MTVRYRQLTHDFKFGVFVNPDTHPIQRVPCPALYCGAAAEMGINLLPIPLLWSLLEAEREIVKMTRSDRFPASELKQGSI